MIREEQIQRVLLESRRLDVRCRTERIIHIAKTINKPGCLEISGPGGRHDNNFADICKIKILPTPDELASKDPFLCRAGDIEDAPNRGVHIDNQSRLLREDFICELREEIYFTLSAQAEGRRHTRRSLVVDNVSLDGVLRDAQQPWVLQLRCNHDLPHFPSTDYAARLAFLEENPKFLQSQSVVCLLAK